MPKTEKKNRAVCRNCKTRYDTTGMGPGIPFSCRKCGEVVYAPGERPGDQQDKAELPFGQSAVEMGYITTAQLATALKVQRAAGKTRLRLGDILVEKGFLTPKQVSSILHRQGSRVAFLIPGYEIVEKLGQGGMGAVYKGVHLASRKTVAMKILGERLSRRPEFLERFHREARVAIDLDHPNIVKGFDEGSVGDTHYFVMEYVHGKCAGRVLKKRGRFGERRAMDIARQTVRALEYAHSRSIVHRDIKPDNLMITREGKVKLADYGLVKYMDDMNEAGLTTEGQIMGTPNYISPEQASGKKVIDIRSDIYSLGATLFHLLTGRPPYEGSSVGVIMGMHISAAVPDPKAANGGLSDEVSAIIMRMMQKELDARYQTPAELLRDVDAYFVRKPTKAGVAASSGEIRPTPAPWDTVTPGVAEEVGDDSVFLEDAGEDHAQLSRLAPLLFSVGFFLLVVGLAAAAFTVWHGGEEQTPAPSVIPTEGGDGTSEPRPDDGAAVVEVSAAEGAAGALYKQALELEGDERTKALRDLVRKYPRTQVAQLVRRDLAVEDRRRNKDYAADRRRRQQERAMAANKAYVDAAAQKHQGTKAYEAALLKVIRTYPGTEGARLAQKDLARFRKEQATQPRTQQPDEQTRLAREEKKRKEEMARVKFIDAFYGAVKGMDWSQAKAWAHSLATDKRYPGLQRLGRDCEADMDGLLRFYPAVIRALDALSAKREEVTITFGKNTDITGRVLTVENNEVRMLIRRSMVYRQPITSLSLGAAESLFRDGYKDKDLAADIVVALFYFAQKDKTKAKTFFDKAHRSDPRRYHHRQMLNWE